MATHDYVIDNSTGANVRADINNVLQAILTNNSSSSAPSTTAAYMWWADTTSGTLKIRNSSDNAWVELFQLDGTLTLEDGSASTPALAFRDDLNTGIFSSAADKFNIATGGVERMELGSQTVFNEDGADVDFRIEGDTDENLFRVDAGNNRIGIKASSPEAILHVHTSSNDQGILLKSTGSTSNAFQFDANRSGSAQGLGSIKARWNGTTVSQIFMNTGSDTTNKDDGYIAFGTESAASSGNANATERMRIDSSGRLLLGTTTEGAANADEFTISTSAATGMTIRSGSSDAGSLFFSDATSGTGEYAGYLQYDHATNYLAIGTSSTERMRMLSDGRVLIGTTTGAAFSNRQLSVASSSGTTSLELRSATDGDGRIIFTDSTDSSNAGAYKCQIKYLQSSDDFIISSNGDNERFRIDSSGNVGIGVTPTMAAGGGLHIRGPAGNQTRLHMTTNRSGDGTGDGFYIIQQGDESTNNETNFINYETASMKFSTSGTERMRIHSTGDFLHATTSTSAPDGNGGTLIQSDANGSFVRISKKTTSAVPAMEFYNANGRVGQIIPSGSSTSFTTSSDYRLKENATAISDGITRLKTLKPYRFNFKAAPKVTVDGFFAHEVTAVPEAISGTKDEVDSDNSPVYQGIDQSKLVPLLVAAVQELIIKVETLEAA